MICTVSIQVNPHIGKYNVVFVESPKLEQDLSTLLPRGQVRTLMRVGNPKTAPSWQIKQPSVPDAQPALQQLVGLLMDPA